MKLIADLHTHSSYSKFNHGKDSIEQLAIRANELGLQEIAITDHGFKHLFGTNKAKLEKARKEVDEINKWSKTKVLLGVEADIISSDGTIDVDVETLGLLDILIVGYHRMIKTDFAGYFGSQKKTKEAKEKATQAFLNAIKRYPISIISHIDSVLTTDLYEIGKACKEKGVLIEINNRHTKWNEDQINDLIASDCMFVVSSDAHSREQVGVVDRAINYITKYKIPSENIANVEFKPHEMSEADKEAQIYYNIYTQKEKQKQDKIIAREAKRKVEFTENLSPEMEEALAKIAQEKGLNYNPKTDEDEEEEYSSIDSFLDSDVMAQAEQYLSKLKETNKIDENISAESFDNFNKTGEIVEDSKQNLTSDEIERHLQEIENAQANAGLAEKANETAELEGLNQGVTTNEVSSNVPKKKHIKGALFEGSKTVADEPNFKQNSQADRAVETASQNTQQTTQSQKPTLSQQTNRGGAFFSGINLGDSQKQESSVTAEPEQVEVEEENKSIKKGAVIERNTQKRLKKQAGVVEEQNETPASFLNFSFDQRQSKEEVKEKDNEEPQNQTHEQKVIKSSPVGFKSLSELIGKREAKKDSEND